MQHALHLLLLEISLVRLQIYSPCFLGLPRLLGLLRLPGLLSILDLVESKVFILLCMQPHEVTLLLLLLSVLQLGMTTIRSGVVRANLHI